MRRTAERRNALLELLCERRSDFVCNLAFELGVTERTIRNDLQELSLFYPIYTVQGRGGGVFVVDGFRLGRRYLSSEQIELLKELSCIVDEGKRERIIKLIREFSLPRR